jgi:hypothetical protein
VSRKEAAGRAFRCNLFGSFESLSHQKGFTLQSLTQIILIEISLREG